MPTYEITSPDGRRFQVTAPQGATQDQVLAYAQKSYQAPEMAAPDPTDGMGTLDKLAAGAGAGITSAMRALGMDSAVKSLGLPATKEEAASLDAPLDNSTAGKIGRGVGLVGAALPAVLVPGANTYLGATALGGLTGAALTEGDLTDRAKGAALGAAGGAAGKAVGDVVGKGANYLMGKRATEMAARQAANLQKDAATVAARDAGYVLPPADAKGGFLNEMLNGLSGKIKTAQVASSRNQATTDALARQAVGKGADDVLSADVLQSVRNQAATQGYAPVRSAGTVTADKVFLDALDNIASTSQGAARSFPGLKNDGVTEVVSTLKQQTFDAGDAIDATRVLRDMADKAYRAGDKQLGKAYKSASDAVEGQLERHLQASGQPDALKAFQEARKLIAKTYTVQKALNDQTGNVSAPALAKMLEKGKPLSGELETIAKTAQAFPKATQMLKETPKAVSPLDYALAAMTGTASGNPLGLATIAARPMARNLILSQPYQNNMLTNAYAPGLMDGLLLPALSSEAARRGMAPVGTGFGLLGGTQN